MPVLIKDIVTLLLIVTGKFVEYIALHNFTLIISFSLDSHSESKEESSMLSGLSELVLLFSGCASVV